MMHCTRQQQPQQRQRRLARTAMTAAANSARAVAMLTLFATVGTALVLSHVLPIRTTSTTTATSRRLTLSSLPIPTTSCSTSSTMQLSMAEKTKEQQQQEEFDFAPSSRNNNKNEVERTRGRPEPGTPLRMICDEQREFEMNLGKACDTLKRDYPYILTDHPDFSIYSDDLEMVDPSGVTLHGLSKYKNFFRLVHFLINTIYCPDRSGLTFRLVYDCARNNIRVHWNAYVVPKAIFGGTKTTLHVDGISVYEICRGSGKITQHRVEHLLINDIPYRPEEGIFHALHQEVDPDFIPALNIGGGNNIVQFQPLGRLRSPTSSLFSMSSSATTDEENGQGNHFVNDLDRAALERKNASRKKFGMKPLTPEEFIQLEAQVQQMDSQRRQAAAASAAEMSKKKDENQENFLKKLFGDALENTCESNFDCERPLVCCDFGFKKTCCYSGARVVEMPALVPVPVETGYPGSQGPPRNF